MKLFLSAAVLLAAKVSAFAPMSGVSTMNKGLQMSVSEENCEDRRTFGKVGVLDVMLKRMLSILNAILMSKVKVTLDFSP